MYAGIVYSADAVFGLLRFASGPSRPLKIAAGAVITVVAFDVSGDIVRRGLRDLEHRPRSSNDGLDDRRNIRFLLANHRPG